jgi:hypothetical protein
VVTERGEGFPTSCMQDMDGIRFPYHSLYPGGYACILM